MEKEPVKTVIAYTLSYQEDSDCAIIDLVIRSLDDGWVTILCETDKKVNPYKLYSYSPSLRDLRVEDLTVITIHVMDHWYVMAGGIWQVGWSPTEDRYVLYNICASNIELVEIKELLWTQEEEYIEMAKLYAQNCLEIEQLREQKLYDKCELLRCEEVEVNRFRAELRRGFAKEPPVQTWIMAFLCYVKEESDPIERYLLVGRYLTPFPYSCHRLNQSGDTFSVGPGYI